MVAGGTPADDILVPGALPLVFNFFVFSAKRPRGRLICIFEWTNEMPRIEICDKPITDDLF